MAIAAVKASTAMIGAAVAAGALLLATSAIGVLLPGARGTAAPPATPYASSTWAELQLDPTVYTSGVSGNLAELAVRGDGEQAWDIATGPGSNISPHVPSATGTAEVNTTTAPASARARADGAYTQLLVPQPADPTGPAQVINQYGTPNGDLTRILHVSTWQNSVNCTYPYAPIFLTSAVDVQVLGRSIDVTQQLQTETFDLPGDFGPGASGVRLAVTSQQLQEIDGLLGHAELDLSATAQLLDEEGAPTGAADPLFDLVLGDVRMDCSAVSPTPTATGTETISPSVSPSESPSESPSPSPTSTGAPSESPSAAPTESPSVSPSESPSDTPSGNPSGNPSGSASPSAPPSTSASASTPVAPGGGSGAAGGSAGSGGQPSLPITGTSLAALAGTGLAIIGVAVALLVLARRRRT
ncbi:hypothetical protein Athai_50040 [Actinocatenispora thailandica]|uniref:Gram-positive cocci surface proteins LPxTG domain-containing protein n=1 Tax=Actinocatenispora thailandica TaxID=227318 RepID=A0A7R7DTL0_9ACTN|nr:hypothetical protein [Actinocatenispora thailandica]BCJ37501.1 hypothetical protein Athai_50040 [Actinocatenispora thailandica]